MGFSNTIPWSTWWGHWTKTDKSCLSNQGVRQGFVLSPKNVFCSTSLGNLKMANMGGNMFVWIWSWWWLATTFGHLQNAVRWSEVRWLPRLRPRQSKGKGIRSQMVGLHVAMDIDYHLQSAKRTFFANKSIFLSRRVSIRNKLKFFDAIVTPITCLGAWPGASVLPIWTNLISTSGWSSRRDMLAWSMARNSACLESVFALRPPESKWNSTTTIP